MKRLLEALLAAIALAVLPPEPRVPTRRTPIRQAT
jgi:hypothetical protein